MRFLVFLWELFLMVSKIYLYYLWPPNAFRFIKNWRDPLSGTGFGPGLYRLFLPLFFVIWLAAILTDILFIVGAVYLMTGMSYVR